MAEDTGWCASALALTEAHVTLCHSGLSADQLRPTIAALRTDWEYFIVAPVDDICLARAREIGCEQRIRTLDAIHLAAAERVPRPAAFLTFDAKQRAVADALGLDLIGAPA